MVALTENPFVKYFGFGENKEGYWSYDHMVVQFEDCVDRIRGIFEDQYDLMFLFDHSSVHVKKKTHGLDAGAMTKGYSGSQLTIRHSKISQTDGILGPYHDLNNPKMVQVIHVRSFYAHRVDICAHGAAYSAQREFF